MAAEVRGLGYVVVDATDLDAWETFATEIFGLMVAERTPEMLRLRIDEKCYRIDVRKSDRDGVSAIGWEAAGPAQVEELAKSVEALGYKVTREDSGVAYKDRLVSGMASFNDPDGTRIELIWGFKEDKDVFVSPTSAQFVTGEGGLGHIFQMVSDEDAFRRLYFEGLNFKLSDMIDFGPLVGVFTHCNPRHHSFAFAAIPGVPPGLGHIMLETTDIDPVGRAYDRVVAGKMAPLSMTLGRHSNDEMISFYTRTPSGFQIEYGTGGLLIDDDKWSVPRYDVPSFWGHVRVHAHEADVIEA